MNKFYFVLFAAMAALFVACKTNGGDKSPSGYNFTKHTNANGKPAKVGDYAFLNITVYQDDSLAFSTYQMGQTVPLKVPNPDSIAALKGEANKPDPVTDVIGFMTVGDSLSVEVPVDSLKRKNPNLANVKKLVYGIRMMDVKTQAEYDQYVMEKRQEVEQKANVQKGRESEVASVLTGLINDFKGGKLGGKLKELPNNLKVFVVEEGTGKPAEPNKKVEVMYYGMLMNGKEFDNSFKRGQPFPFTLGVGQVIPGWDQGVATLKVGSKAVLFIPSELGYGKSGAGEAIPPNSDLAFYVEVLDVK